MLLFYHMLICFSTIKLKVSFLLCYQDETKTVLKNEDIAQIKKSLEVWENKLQETEKELGYEIMTNDEITVIDTETIEKEHFNNVADDILR